MTSVRRKKKKNLHFSLGRIEASVPLPLTPDCTGFRGFLYLGELQGRRKKGLEAVFFCIHGMMNCAKMHILMVSNL